MAFYRDQLGFKVTFTWEDPVSYAVLKRGDIGINLTLRDDLPENYKPMNSLYIFVHDADAVWEEVNAKGAKVLEPIDDRDYGMRDFLVEDPNGYRIVFGKGLN